MEPHTLTDREMMADALASQKQAASCCNTFAGECASPALLAEFLNLLGEEHQIQYEIFAEMQKRGWYPTTPATLQQLIAARQKFLPTTNN